MRTESAAVALALLGAGVMPLRAQDALSGVGSDTEVRSIEFRFEDHQAFEERDLAGRIALTAPGSLVGLRKFFGFIPFVPPVGVHPFDPLELQRDVIRLRNHYHRSGFPKAEVHYDARYDAKPDQVRVAFVIREGPPLMVDSLGFTVEGDTLGLPAELRSPWAGFMRTERKRAGRYGEVEGKALADSTIRWFRKYGYPFAEAEPIAAVDTAANRADVIVHVRPGMRARIRAIEVTGNARVTARHITRQLPIGPGDWYDGAALEEGRQKLVQMDIVRLALVDVPKEQADDSTVVVRIDVTENPPRLVRGEAGITSAGGLGGEAEWTHRSFLGGLRTLTFGVAAQTGALSFEGAPQQLYRVGVTLFQPYVGDRRLSAAGGPFVEYRNDLRDRSRAVGFEGALVYSTGPLRSISLGYNITYRRVLDYGLGDNLDPSVYLPRLGLATPEAAGTLEEVRNRSTVALEGTYGRLDRFANPRRGYVIRPRIEVTTPGFNTSEYFLADIGGTAFVPLTSRIGFTLRASAGRIFPFGRSLRQVGAESPFVSLLRLRDVAFTAGGSRDVRGWGSQLVGPKLPEIRLETDGDSVRSVADRYAPVGGLGRLVGSAEIQLPMPGLSQAWQSFLFLDAGRIWSPDSRFALNAGEIDQDKVFAAVGAGVGYETVVGAIQIALGYKLNPSPLDLRSPQAVLEALEAGRPIESVPAEPRRRLHLHFAIGSSF